jgi:hypothetical protein
MEPGRRDIFRRRGSALKRLQLYGDAVNADLLIRALGAFGELLQIDDTSSFRRDYGDPDRAIIGRITDHYDVGEICRQRLHRPVP